MLLLESPPPATLSTGRYRLDVDRCITEFSVRHMVFSTLRGRVQPKSGQLVVAKDPSKSWVRVDLDAASITTGNVERDAMLRAESLVNADEYPLIRFESVAVTERGDGRWSVDGDLYLGPTVVQVDLDARLVSAGDGRVRFAATAAVDRDGLGLQWPALVERYGVVISSRVHVIVAAEFVA